MLRAVILGNNRLKRKYFTVWCQM